MTEEFFYHYTNAISAKRIFLSGKILPSRMSNGDAVHGDGVYLTTLEPRLGRETIEKNNWDGAARSQDKKMEVYFEILIPSSKVTRAKEKRDIQVHTGELSLAEYKWSLKNWEGELLATQYFMVSSEGEATKRHGLKLGRYTLCQHIVTHDYHPVYKQDGGDSYLYTSKYGNWSVGPVAGDQVCWLVQYSESSPSPNRTIPWMYYDNSVGKTHHDKNDWKVDETLKVYPCY